jgi:hypothetical protein
MNGKNLLRLLALAAFVATASSAQAQWGPNEELNCNRAPGTKGSITLSGQANSAQGDSSKLEQYEEIPEGVLVPCATFNWDNGKYVFDAKAIDVGYDDQMFGATFAKKGGFGAWFNWDQNPNWQSNTARTPFTGSGSSFLSAPDDMQLALQNVYAPWVPATASNPIGVGTAPANPTVPGFYAVGDYVNLGLPAFDLRYVRKTGGVGIDLPVGQSGLAFNVNYTSEWRDGNKNTTFYGGPSYEVATPVDYKTDNLHLGAEYAKGRFFLAASADFNQFENADPFVTIENPERLQLNNPTNGRAVINDATSFRLWMYPDNEAYQVDLTGGITLPARNKVTASLSTGNMSMEMSGLPNISTNDSLQTSATAPNPLFTIVPPYSSIGAEYDTFMTQVKWTGDPIKWFGYILSYRKFELDDKTEDYHFTSTVRGDVGASYNATGFTREHEGWGSESLRAEVHFLPVRGLRLGAQFAREKRDYDIREYADVDDDVWTLSADYSHPLFQFHGAWSALDRQPGDPNDEAIQPTWQGATQTDITERDRHILSGLVTFTPTAKIALSVNGAKTTNEFAESVTGLLDQSFETFGVDLTYAPNDRVNLMAGYVREDYYFLMAASYIPRGTTVPEGYDPTTDPNYWENDTDDTVDTFRAAVAWKVIPDKLDLDFTYDYTYQKSDSMYNLNATGTPIGGLNEANGVFPANVPPVPGFPVTTFDSFPQVLKEFTMAKFRLAYHFSKNLTASVLYWKQKYENDDWQTETLQPYMALPPSAAQPLGGDPGSNRWFFLGARVPSYDADIFRASVTYTF